jgi:hypothetical protein
MKSGPEDKLPFHLTIRDLLKAFWKTILVWVIILIFIAIGIHYNVDKIIIGGVVVVFGLITQAFVGLIGIISLIPLIGPIIAKILALPIFWLINALGYFVSLIAIKRGYSKDVINYRVLTIVLLVGIVIGFVLGKII